MNSEFGFHSMSPFTDSIRTDGELDSSHEKKKVNILFWKKIYISYAFYIMHSIYVWILHNYEVRILWKKYGIYLKF